jgi:hypothetical protein
MSTEALADTLEQGIELNLAEIRAEMELLGQDERNLAEWNAELVKSQLDFLHCLKRMPEAADPDSEVAGWLREINREWRKIHAHPRGRRKKT